MDIEKLIQGIGKVCAKMFFNKEEKSSETINIQQMSSEDLFKIFFNKSFHDQNYNEAEDLLFKELENNYSIELFDLANEFYNSLLNKSDDELLNRNFPRGEIYQGLRDIQKFRVN